MKTRRLVVIYRKLGLRCWQCIWIVVLEPRIVRVQIGQWSLVIDCQDWICNDWIGHDGLDLGIPDRIKRPIGSYVTIVMRTDLERQLCSD